MTAGPHERRIRESLDRARTDPAAAHVYTALLDDDAIAAARAADQAADRGATTGPLAGVVVSVKDLYDIAGRTTLAGSVQRRGAAPATADAEAVRRLRAAGAVVPGLTNMTEFAFSGVGLNPHHGTPRNPADATVARIPGGSSSGAAVSVALGLADAGLGSDTGGSIRVPAALCGLVGFKNTQARTPLAGAFPLSFSLDTACALARSVADCLRVDAVLAGAPLATEARDVRGLRLALPQTTVLDGLDAGVTTAFQHALARLSNAGATIVELPLAEVAEIWRLNAPGGLSAIESWFTHRQAMTHERHLIDPRIASRIAAGDGVLAADYLQILAARRDWIARVEQRLAGFDAVICPTVPMVAPPIAEVDASDEAFFKANAALLRNTFVFNFLDGCAFSLPCHERGALPVGLMLGAPRGRDAHLASVALAVEPLLAPR
jgi:aspartyl-tRNA(Asn)/glutamyl-tRNA(Gln) amidotransferase subunit A